MDFTGSALLGGSGGANGTLLLDPTDLTIGAAQAGSIVASLASGNVVVATSGSGAGTGNLTISSAISYTSANALTFLANGSVRVNAAVRNAGTGEITAIAGWDGTTGADGSVSGAGFLANAGSYGNNSGSIFIGSATQATATSFGSKDGDLFLGGNTANPFTQIGWHAVDQGAAHVATGDIALALKGALSLQAGSADRSNAQVGHGGNLDGTVQRDINLTIGGETSLAAGSRAEPIICHSNTSPFVDPPDRRARLRRLSPQGQRERHRRPARRWQAEAELQKLMWRPARASDPVNRGRASAPVELHKGVVRSIHTTPRYQRYVMQRRGTGR